MKNGLTKISLSCLLILLILLAGCCINIGCFGKAKCEKTEQLSTAFPAGGTLDVETDCGSITVTGADVTDCNIIATVCVKASTNEKAQKIAEAVKISFEQAGQTLTIETEKPHLRNNCSIGVSFNITVPKQTSLRLRTDVGKIRVSDISQQIEAQSDVGSITCKQISGDIDLKVDVGKATVVYSDTAPPICNATVKTDVGAIDFTGPPNMSAQLDLHTDVGSINTNREIKITGKISKNRLKGTIGTGEGKLHLSTDVGSINLK